VEEALPEGSVGGTESRIREGSEDSQLIAAPPVAGRSKPALGSAPFRHEEQAMSKTGFAKEHLKSFIERIERLEEEKAALAADIREVYSEAKGTGFDVKIMRQVVRLRKLDTADRQEQDAILDLYLSALGMGRE
jgi:uncharacterized protein (UPF0335 family)